MPYKIGHASIHSFGSCDRLKHGMLPGKQPKGSDAGTGKTRYGNFPEMGRLEPEDRARKSRARGQFITNGTEY